MPRTYTPALRERLGLTEEQLPDAATDEEIAEALKAAPVVAAAGPRQRVTHERDRRTPQEALTHDEREGLLIAAVGAGKFSPKRAKHWREQLIADPTGAAQIIAMLEPAPALGGRAATALPGQADEMAYPSTWLGPHEQDLAQVANPPLAPGHGIQASAFAGEDGSGYTSTPALEEDEAYPAAWIGGKPTVQEGPIGFEDPGMRGLNGPGVSVDGQNADSRRTKART